MVAAAWCLLLLEGPSMALPPNKLVVGPPDPDLEVCCCAGVVEIIVLPLSFSHQGDGGGERLGDALNRSAWREVQVAANGGVHQLRRRCAAVIHGQRDRSVLWCCSHCRFFNLLAGEPNRRPICDLATALIVNPSPSGLVPGDGAGGRDVERVFFLGGEGPDCTLHSFLGVLCAILEGLFVISFSSEFLGVICKPTV
jgi:hypothetical protein